MSGSFTTDNFRIIAEVADSVGGTVDGGSRVRLFPTITEFGTITVRGTFGASARIDDSEVIEFSFASSGFNSLTLEIQAVRLSFTDQPFNRIGGSGDGGYPTISTPTLPATNVGDIIYYTCLLYTSPSPRDS